MIFRARTYDPAEHASPAAPPPAAIPADLADSALGRENERPLARLLEERVRYPAQHFWIALVPGTSERWGHHRAPPREAEARGEWISREFKTRIARAFALLDRGIVRFVLISGGSVDPTRPEYNEARRGRDHLLAAHGPQWAARGDLRERVLLDPIAQHSTTNVRNADKLCLALGLDRVLIATTMPPTPVLWPRYVPVVGQTNQGWYFLHHTVSTFDWRCRRTLGYALGRFDWFHAQGVSAIAHHGFARERLERDVYGG